MKKKTIYLLLIAVLLLTVVPASAKSKEPVGEKINLFFGGAQTFDAGEPFYIAHGFAFDPPGDKPGPNYSFTLEIDDVLQTEDYRTRDHLTWLWTFNYPDGMSGSHTFVATWYAPCSATDTPSCPDKHAPVITHETTTVITFAP